MAGPATGNDEALLEDWMAASDYASDIQISGLCGLQIEVSPAVPVQSETWGRIKANYDRP